MVLDDFDDQQNSKLFDLAPKVITVPSAEDVRTTDPEVYLKRLSEISSPSERLRIYLFSIFDIYGLQDPTHETTMTRYMIITGLSVGWIAGGLIRSSGLHQEYARQHNASVFDHKYRSGRHRIDTFLHTIFRRGLKYGVGSALLCGSAGVIGFGSINYRGKLHYPDWAVGFSILGALTRVWVSPRAIAMGGLLGLAAGSFGYGFARSQEIIYGKSVTQIRYLNHMDYVEKRDAKRLKLQKLREDYNNEVFKDVRGL